MSPATRKFKDWELVRKLFASRKSIGLAKPGHAVARSTPSYSAGELGMDF